MPSITFCLAKKNNKLGIEYSKFILQRFDTAFWKPNEFLIVTILPLNDTIAGWSLMPWMKIENTHVTINRSFFGMQEVAKFKRYNEGATLIHLLGNSMGLYDLWYQNGKDDKVYDTPLHNDPNDECPADGHVNTIDGKLELYFNYMDNTNDKCLYSFTHGQIRRILAANLITKSKILRNKNIDCDAEPIDIYDENYYPNINIAVSPNPTIDNITVTLSEELMEDFSIKVIDAQGKTKLETSIKGRTKFLNLESLSGGIYTIEVNVNQQIITSKFIKNN